MHMGEPFPGVWLPSSRGPHPPGLAVGPDRKRATTSLPRLPAGGRHGAGEMIVRARAGRRPVLLASRPARRQASRRRRSSGADRRNPRARQPLDARRGGAAPSAASPSGSRGPTQRSRGAQERLEASGRFASAAVRQPARSIDDPGRRHGACCSWRSWPAPARTTAPGLAAPLRGGPHVAAGRCATTTATGSPTACSRRRPTLGGRSSRVGRRSPGAASGASACELARSFERAPLSRRRRRRRHRRAEHPAFDVAGAASAGVRRADRARGVDRGCGWRRAGRMHDVRVRRRREPTVDRPAPISRSTRASTRPFRAMPCGAARRLERLDLADVTAAAAASTPTAPSGCPAARR